MKKTDYMELYLMYQIYVIQTDKENNARDISNKLEINKIEYEMKMIYKNRSTIIQNIYEKQKSALAEIIKFSKEFGTEAASMKLREMISLCNSEDIESIRIDPPIAGYQTKQMCKNLSTWHNQKLEENSNFNEEFEVEIVINELESIMNISDADKSNNFIM